jgi:HPt (histidine-containing phosphotransfer) domain-containing protein
MFSSAEIQQRVKSGYMESIGVRLRKMRKQLMNREWEAIKSEATHLAEGAQNFGYSEIALEIQKTIVVLNQRPLTRTAIDPEAKRTLENLFQSLDRFLTKNSSH